MLLSLHLLIDPNVSRPLILELDKYLMDVFPFDKVNTEISVEIPSSCWNTSRRQYDANCLLTYSSSYRRSGKVLLIISKDIYVPELNFVFGIASKGLGAVVSVYRLENDPEFVQKEITHELGHVFGLNHCTLPCVMTFSNSVWEARLKSGTFCKKCRKGIQRFF
jgi:archaemetzincin